MAEIILHHYAISPFAEKIRAILGYKGLAWRSVDIPPVMPKPDLTALTGGYRKTPVLQIGCDVYCDTARIVRVLDEIAPERPVRRVEQDALAVPAGRWLDHHLFFAVIALSFDPAAGAGSDRQFGGRPNVEAFLRDRGPMIATARVKPPRLADARVIVGDALRMLEGQLAARGPFLFGEAIGWADFCAYHALWAMRSNAALAPQLDDHPQIVRWLDRIRDFGHGSPEPLDSGDALAIARQSKPRPLAGDQGPPLEQAVLGDAVEIAADDYAFEPSAGRLVALGREAIAIERSDPRAGDVIVHFPRIGYRVTRRD
jgi:glutathione S-transferase